ncbi:MAG: histidine kinase dimerization/phospho-acceptor domain-containing protein [Actinomycetota bacterium]
MASEDSFARFVSLACHDLRTPLATVSGFAHTLLQTEELRESGGRYVGMIQAASEQIGELLEDLGLVARIEAGSYEPAVVDADTLELAGAAASRLGDKATFGGAGANVRVDRVPVERGLAGLARCALRHGGLEQVDLTVDGSTVWISPVTPGAAPIVLGEDLKDLSAAAAGRLVTVLGGSLALEGDRVRVSLPT